MSEKESEAADILREKKILEDKVAENEKAVEMLQKLLEVYEETKWFAEDLKEENKDLKEETQQKLEASIKKEGILQRKVDWMEAWLTDSSRNIYKMKTFAEDTMTTTLATTVPHDQVLSVPRSLDVDTENSVKSRFLQWLECGKSN